MRSRRAGALLVAVGVVLAACASDSYPIHGGPVHAWQAAPAALGDRVPAVVLFLDPRPGDRFTLIGAEAVGLTEGATVTFYFSPPIIGEDGSFIVGDKLEPLAGAEFAATSGSAVPDDAVGIVAEMSASQPGRYTLAAVRLRFTLNGGREHVTEGIDVMPTICVDDPKPADCPEEPAD